MHRWASREWELSVCPDRKAAVDQAGEMAWGA